MHYKTTKIYNNGDNKEEYTTIINVGSRSKKSLHFVEYSTMSELLENGNVLFSFSFDGEIIKKAIYDPKTKKLKNFNFYDVSWKPTYKTMKKG